MTIRDILSATDLDVGTIWAQDPGYEHIPWAGGPFRKFFRATPGLRLRGNHETYEDMRGRCLAGANPVPALATGVRIEHRTDHREPGRHAQQVLYYRLRAEQKAER